jgi:serine/threonine protein kinase
MQKEEQEKLKLKVGETPLEPTPLVEPHSNAVNALASQNSGAFAGKNADLYIDDRYEVIEFIGEGGMGSVYKVKDRVLEKTFAVKLVKPELLKDNIAMKRFEQEAQSAISLTHPHLVSVYGHKLTASGQPFLLMDFHKGHNLAEILNRRGKVAPEIAVDLFVRLSDALTHAHTKGIIHRDLKPSNIIIDENESGKLDPKIVDFGISKILSSNITTMGFTKDQQMVGSPHYMSPEMCRGEKLDARSDIYSLGCVMFEVLEGRPPYQMENPFQTLMQHVNGDLPKFAPPSAVPSPLQGIVLKCLEKDPAHRYQSMDQLRRDLERYQSGQKLEFAKPRKLTKVKPIHMVIAGGAIACFATGLLLSSILVLGGSHGPSTPPPSDTLSSVPLKPIPPAIDKTDSGDNLLTWNLPTADPNDPESLLRRLKAAEEQSDLLVQLKISSRNRGRIAYEQQRLREEATQTLGRNTQIALVEMGEKVIPTLLLHISDNSRRVQQVCFGALKELGTPAIKPSVERFMEHGKSAKDAPCANLIAEMGKPAITELMKYVKKGGNEQDRALQFILVASTRGSTASIEISDVPDLVKVINSDSEISIKRNALLILVTVADRTEIARDLFVKIAQDVNAPSDLRVTSISALGATVNMESAEASALTQKVLQKIALTDKDSYIRFAATSNIAALGPKARPSIAALTKLSKDRDASVSMASRVGLAMIDGAEMKDSSRLSTNDIPTFVGEINSSIDKQKLIEKINNFGGVVSHTPFYTVPTHPDFCGFATPVLMNYSEQSTDRSFDRHYTYETLSKLGRYGSPATAWVAIRASRDTDQWGRSGASQALLSLLGITQRY